MTDEVIEVIKQYIEVLGCVADDNFKVDGQESAKLTTPALAVNRSHRLLAGGVFTLR